MVFLENDMFLSELTKLFQKSRTTGTGSVKVTVKKYDGRDRPTPKPPKEKSKKGKGKAKEPPAPAAPTTGKRRHGHSESEKSSCLMRAKLHNRKISTVVTSKDINRFQVAYCNLLKGNMDGLKKVKKVKTKIVKTTT